MAGKLGLASHSFDLSAGSSNTVSYGVGALLLARCSVSNKIGLYMLPATGSELIEVISGGGYSTYYSISVANNKIVFSNVSSVNITMWVSLLILS